MNVIEILVLLAFILFPVLQALLERAGKGREQDTLPPPEPDVEEEAPARVVVVERPQPQTARGSSTEHWSAGWGSWPGEEEGEEEIRAIEALSAEEVITEDQADELIAFQERYAAQQIPEATRVTVPVVSMEQLRVDRGAEHRRFHDRVAETPRPAPRVAPEPLRRVLRRPAAVEQAILLAEVLGPPRSMRPLDRQQ